MKEITETRAKEIFKSPSKDKYSWDELKATDNFIAMYALDRLRKKLSEKDIEDVLFNFIISMATIHIGDAVIDNLLRQLGCYPNWM